MADVPEVVLSEYGETLRPTHGVPKFEGEGLQALVLDLTALGEWGRDFDAPWNPTVDGWDATPQQRFERLLKETEHPIGILFNGAALRLVHPYCSASDAPVDDEDDEQAEASVMRALLAKNVFACLQDAFSVFRDQAPGLR